MENRLYFLKKQFAEKDEQSEINVDKELFQFALQTYRVMRVVLIFCEAVMVFAISNREGGPFATERRTGYFWMYIFLIVVSVLFTIIDNLWIQRKWTNYNLYIGLGFIYAFFMALWACAITSLDKLGGNGLVVFTYMLVLISVLAVLKTWQIFVLFGGTFVLLNVILPYFPAPGGDQTFNNLANSFFITVMAIVISLYFNKSRMKNYRNKKIIDAQNKALCEINEQLKKEVIVDYLTGLYNRRYMTDIVELRFHECSISKGNRSIACLMVDVDFFKQYNDTYGHQKGDDCLKEIANIIKSCFCMDAARAVRYGGEEFAIFITDCEIEQAKNYADSLRNGIEKKCILRKDIPLGYLTVSIGVFASIPSNQLKLNNFISCADKALYAAKNAGRNCVQVYSGVLEV